MNEGKVTCRMNFLKGLHCSILHHEWAIWHFYTKKKSVPLQRNHSKSMFDRISHLQPIHFMVYLMVPSMTNTTRSKYTSSIAIVLQCETGKSVKQKFQVCVTGVTAVVHVVYCIQCKPCYFYYSECMCLFVSRSIPEIRRGGTLRCCRSTIRNCQSA